jgi:uncharacterized membrane protein YvbJ
MFCGECGTQNPENGDICIRCGNPLGKSQLEAQPVTASCLAKQKKNWPGIGSIICGFLSWGILTPILAVAAIALGGFSLYRTKKETGKIAFSAIAGMVIAGTAIFVLVFIS